MSSRTVSPLPQVGYYYPNRIVLNIILALEDVIGRNGVHALLRLAQLPNLVEDYPPGNLNREVGFAALSAINIALEELYGLRGSRGLATQAGRAAFEKELLRSTAALEENFHDVVNLPPFEMLYQGIPAVTSMYNQLTGQSVSLHKEAGMVILENPACPFCWGRNDQDHPVCFMFVGMLRAGLTWIYSELDYQIKEANCCAKGDHSCKFKLHI